MANGSAGEPVVEALLGGSTARISPEELDRIAELIEQARRDGTK